MATDSKRRANAVQDQNGQTLAYLYFEDEPLQRISAKLLTPEARRIAADIARQAAAACWCKPNSRQF